ncbi:hypothetical protein PFFVO_01911 [Plasmodium falciparum Vietnam Oak-Knoll (FVO)]|uniref:Uncharacterized protein n=1 Tax=Plasmodium falciparum Vietnam Oak-Knoll (FVO) TaxID=1036723 RepID=A0A024V939_PLAFA|nr:hypothetical protein PFFVO_01911 [Plasmodium falciparum Vietnam Oak-Knoll (FVO)]
MNYKFYLHIKFSNEFSFRHIRKTYYNILLSYYLILVTIHIYRLIINYIISINIYNINGATTMLTIHASLYKRFQCNLKFIFDR